MRNSVKCEELMKVVYLPDPGPVELLLRELAISKSDHQDDDVTPLIIGSDVVLSLRCLAHSQFAEAGWTCETRA